MVYNVPDWIALCVLTAKVLKSLSSAVLFKSLVFVVKASRINDRPGMIMPPW